MAEERADFEMKGAIGIAWIENLEKGNALGAGEGTFSARSLNT